MMRQMFTRALFAMLLLPASFVQATKLTPEVAESVEAFKQAYSRELGAVSLCDSNTSNKVAICSDKLRHEGNAPFILHHSAPTEQVVVLFHGLSDSPYYFKSIAQAAYDSGANVVVGLLPGHGLKEAGADMADPELANRWRNKVAEVINLARPMGKQVIIGGFSTGGSLTLNYLLREADAKVTGLMQFSGAMALPGMPETLSRVPGIDWVLRKLDGEYSTESENPFKYPGIAMHSVAMLMDVIDENRDLMIDNGLKTHLFVAHSMADTTALFSGTEHLMRVNDGENYSYLVPEEDGLCHADLVLDKAQEQEIAGYIKTPQTEPCYTPSANATHGKMMQQMQEYLQSLKALNQV